MGQERERAQGGTGVGGMANDLTGPGIYIIGLKEVFRVECVNTIYHIVCGPAKYLIV